jgi:Cof subfamily protein (haloacid dehalogenase superfamily)
MGGTVPPYRLLVVDVDGTLAGAGGSISPGVAAAVRAAEAAGVRVALSTGRTVLACRSFLAELPMRGPHIFFDGSLVLDPAADTAVLLRHVDPDAVAAALAFGEAHGLTVELYTRDSYYVRAVTPEVEAHAALQRCAPTVADLAGVLAGGEVIKAEFVVRTDAAVAAVRAFEPSVAGRLRFSWATAPGLPDFTFVNIVAPDASKGEAMRRILDHLGLSPAEVVAVGDGANDLPMFEVAGLAVAMGNAPAAVRQAAHLVVGTVEQDGLAEVISRRVLGVE